jgi:RNA polymerase sigma-70 factor (ECF subfamily)
VDRLPDDMRLILTLRFGEDLPVAEIARILRLPVGTVSSRISRAKQRLREDLIKEEKRHD